MYVRHGTTQAARVVSHYVDMPTWHARSVVYLGGDDQQVSQGCEKGVMQGLAWHLRRTSCLHISQFLKPCHKSIDASRYTVTIGVSMKASLK